MWPFGKRIESVFRVSYFFEAKALIINYENRVRGQVMKKPPIVTMDYQRQMQKRNNYQAASSTLPTSAKRLYQTHFPAIV